MKKKVVIRVWMDGKRCLPKALKIAIYVLKLIMPYDIIWKRSISSEKLSKKAMKIAAAFPGIASVAYAPDGKDKLVVTGEDIDAVNLTRSIRRNVGFAEILSLENDEKK